MKAKILPWPGDGCIHFYGGRCLYDERMNPGLREEWRCTVLTGMLHEYDLFVASADAFELDDAVAATIWRRRMVERMASLERCPGYSPRESSDWKQGPDKGPRGDRDAVRPGIGIVVS